MHRRLEAELLPLDTEIERTLINLKKVSQLKKQAWQGKEKVTRIFLLATDRPQ